MISLVNIAEAQTRISEAIKAQRIQQGFTQKGLAERAGVSLASLRKFEQKGSIALESLLKLLLVLGGLEAFIEAIENEKTDFQSIDDVLTNKTPSQRKRGWRS